MSKSSGVRQVKKNKQGALGCIAAQWVYYYKGYDTSYVPPELSSPPGF
jgi:hypothetical protein